MKITRASKPQRLLFTVASLILWLGIYLTGFSTVHWLLFVPAAFFGLAGLTGICPGLIFAKMILKE